MGKPSLTLKTALALGLLLVLLLLGQGAVTAQDETDPRTIHNACAANCVADTNILHSGMGDTQARYAYNSWFGSYYDLTGCDDPAWQTDILFLIDFIGDSIGSPGAPTLQCWEGLVAQARLCSRDCSNYFIEDALYAPNVALSLNQGSPGYHEVTLENQSDPDGLDEVEANAYSRQFQLKTYLRYGDGESLLVNTTPMPSLSFPNWITRGGLDICSGEYGFESPRCQILATFATPDELTTSVDFLDGAFYDLSSQVSDLSDASGSFSQNGYIRLVSDGDSITIAQGPYAGYKLVKTHYLSDHTHTVELTSWDASSGPITITNEECTDFFSTCWLTGARNDTDTDVYALQGPSDKMLAGTYTVEVVADIPHEKDFSDNVVSYSYDTAAAQEDTGGTEGGGGTEEEQLRVEDLAIIDLPGAGHHTASYDQGLGMLFRLPVPDDIAFMFVRLVSHDGAQYDAFIRRGSIPVPDYPVLNDDYNCWIQADPSYSGACPFTNPNPGDYYIFAHGWQAGAGGSFELEVEWRMRAPTATPTPTAAPTLVPTPTPSPTPSPESEGGTPGTAGTEVEPNDDYATANNWDMQNPFTGGLASRHDVDMLLLNFTESGIYTFSLTDVGPLARLKMTLRRPSSHNTIDSSTASAAGEPVHLTLDASVGEQYYLRISSVATAFNTDQPYTLSLSGFIPDPDEPNDNRASATEWDLTQGPVQGYFWDKTTGRNDYFTFLAPPTNAAEPIVFTLTHPAPEFRMRLILLSENGASLANSSYSAAGQPATLSKVLTAGKRYYLKLVPYQNRTSLQPYALSAQLSPGAAASPTVPPTVLPTASPTPLPPTMLPTASPTPLPPTATPTATPDGNGTTAGNLIYNGDFAQGIAGWSVEQQCQSCGMQINVDPTMGDYLAWARDNSGNDGGAIWARQALNLDVSSCQQLHIAFDVRVDGHTLPNSGWWTDEHGGIGEYPAMVRLAFMPAFQGSPFEWAKGFLIVHDGATQASNWLLVPANTWWHYEADILSPAEWVDAFGNVQTNPGILTAVYVGGSGWDFMGAIDNLVLTGQGCG